MKKIYKLVVVLLFLIIDCFILKTVPYYIITTHYADDEVRVVLDDNEITKQLPDSALCINNQLMLSIDTIKKFIDEYIYYDEKYDTIIVSYDKYVAKIPVSQEIIKINDNEKTVSNKAFKSGDDIYVPINELEQVYNITVEHNEKFIITTKNMEYYSLNVERKILAKKHKRNLSLTTAIIDAGECIKVYDEYYEKDADDYLWIRTEDGSFGYVKKSDIKILNDDIEYVEAKKETINPKISLVWEYAENYTTDRSSESKIDTVDVISPTWFYTNGSSGEVISRVDDAYIRWANKVGYELWPAFVNRGGIDVTSKLLNDMNSRKKLIDNIVSLCKKYNFKGINIDFENMYKEDKDAYSEFIRELSATMKLNDVVLSVDVNVPDGSDTWSLCYDSKAISDAVNYIILMAYDQYGASSKKAGPVASYAWVELNLKKLIEREGVSTNKLVLAAPFYSRAWKLKNGVVQYSIAISMEKANEYLKKQNEWDDDAKQYVVNYNSNGYEIKLWVENEDSLKEKIGLVEKYNLAGIAFWRRGYETNKIWDLLK